MTDNIITVGVDGSPSSTQALRWATALANRSGARLRAVMAWNYPLVATPGLWGTVPAPEQMHGIAETNLSNIIDEVAPQLDVEQIVCQGRSAKCLIDASSDAELLVVGRRGIGGFAGSGLGSTSHHAALHADCSVAVVGDEVESLGVDPTVVVAVDGSDRATDALVWTMNSLVGESSIVAVYSHDEWMLDELPTDVELARRLHADAESKLLEIARSAHDMVQGEETEMAAVRIEVVASDGLVAAAATVRRTSGGARVDLRVVRGDPRTTVLDVADQENADILVVGAQGRTGLAGVLLGSLTTHVIHHCSPTMTVIVARPAPARRDF